MVEHVAVQSLRGSLSLNRFISIPNHIRDRRSDAKAMLINDHGIVGRRPGTLKQGEAKM